MLAGLRVANFGINLPAAVAGARLTELGASVTKVEPPGGDPVADAAPDWYLTLVAGQEVRVIDLKAGRPDELLDACDLLLTATRPGALERLGLGWDELHARFPRLAHVAIIGHAPPHDGFPGHDLTYSAPYGLLAPPALPRTLVADLGGAERAVATGLALLLARERTGTAQRADTALADAADLFARPLREGLTAPGGLLGGGHPFYRLYRAATGWVALAALEQRFREELLRELGLADADAAELERVFSRRSAEEWASWAADRNLPLVAVQ
jgi:alpha-methylacyl-CoA racemase